MLQKAWDFIAEFPLNVIRMVEAAKIRIVTTA
jgi:hypothetical protein